MAEIFKVSIYKWVTIITLKFLDCFLSIYSFFCKNINIQIELMWILFNVLLSEFDGDNDHGDHNGHTKWPANNERQLWTRGNKF